MQSWQLIPLIIIPVVVVYTFTQRGKMRAKASEMYGGAMDALRAVVASARPSDEGEPICFQAIERKMLSAKIYYAALTNRRLVITLAGGDTQVHARGSVKLSMRAKTFADIGNMQTTYSRGWELKLGLPDGTKHTWRVYDDAVGIPDHGAQVQALVAALTA